MLAAATLRRSALALKKLDARAFSSAVRGYFSMCMCIASLRQ